MASGTIATVVSIGGTTINRTAERTGDHANIYEVALPAGEAGTLSTRTDANTGVITSASHAITNAAKVDVFWDSGGCRYGMDVTSYDTNTVTLDGGNGDDLPDANAAVTATQQVQILTAIDGDNVQLIGICLETGDQTIGSGGHVDLQDSTNATIEAIELTANSPWSWDSNSGITNPLTGNPITQCYAANGNNTTAGTLKILSLEDSTP
jgi:hypothetical protein